MKLPTNGGAMPWAGLPTTTSGYRKGVLNDPPASFLQQAVAGDWRKDYIEFWEQLRKRILEKNNYGVAPNDAGPLWMGLRLISPRSESAYQNVTYPKGATVVKMMRSL